MAIAKNSIIVTQVAKDGDTGVAGSIGATGISGSTIRQVKWVPGETYHNDPATVASPRYIDILLIFNTSGIVTDRYQCVSTYTSGTEETAPTGDGNDRWTKVNNMSALYTPLFVADNGDIVFLSSNQILIKDASGTIKAGISGAGSGASGYRFWAGAASPSSAHWYEMNLGKCMVQMLILQVSQCDVRYF